MTKINVRRAICKVLTQFYLLSSSSYFNRKKKKMDAGIGIGGLNAEREEFVDSKFDLFGKTEYEVDV